MQESALSNKTTMVFGQMNEPPGAYAGRPDRLTMAEYFVITAEKMPAVWLTIFSASPRQVRKCPHFWIVYAFCSRLTESNFCRLKWEHFRADYPPQRTVPSLRYRPFTCLRMT